MAASDAIIGFSRWKGQLESLVRLRTKDARVTFSVTFSAPYAVTIHERVAMAWRGRPRRSGRGVYWQARTGMGEAKYLENAIRFMQNSGKFRYISMQVIKAGGTLRKVLQAKADALLAEARKRVPYEYGKLWRSGKVKVRG